MKNCYPFLLSAGLVAGIATSARSQGLVSGFMTGKGHGAVVVSGTTERYNSEYLGAALTQGVPVYEKVRVNSLNLYATYGLTAKLDVVLILPYIQSKGSADEALVSSLNAQFPNQGYTNVRQGLQDLTALLKLKLYSHEIGSSILDLLGVVSYSTPVSDYQSNRGVGYIIAIGNRATKYTAVGVAHLKTSTGLFATGQVGYSLRSGDVPDAVIGEAKIGYAGPKTYVEGSAAFQNSTSGTDIGAPDFGTFTATRVNYLRLSVSAYRPITQGFGLTVGADTYVAGRNVGKATGYSAGVTYNF